jgi:hypothetical protein
MYRLSDIFKQAQFQVIPAESLTIILLANDEDRDLWSLGQTLLAQAIEE